MGGQNSWRVPQDFADLQRNSEKRQLNQERRPQVRTAADLLGPGLAPFAVEISDWNGDETAFNGFFWSQPGAINSPDVANSKWYMGQSEATEDGFGLQWATEFRNIAGNAWPPRSFIRRFFDPGSAGTRSFSAWAEQGDGHYLGEMILYGAEVPPNEKWKFCDGSQISRTTYAEFFTKFQTMPWGIGNGTTTMNLPDWRRRAPRGSAGATDALWVPGVNDGKAVADRTTQHNHVISDQTTGAQTLRGDAGTTAAVPQMSAFQNHSHGGATGQSASTDFPYMYVPIHIKVLP